MFEQVKKDRLYKHIVEQITRSIMRGAMRPGDQLPTEPELAEQFGVSRTVVREAIKALNLQGLVEVTPGRGTFITNPSIETVTNSFQLFFTLEDRSFDELIVARRILEVPIVRMAAENIQPGNLENLVHLMSKMEEMLNDAEGFIHHDTEFHAELARATQNRILSVLIEPIIGMMKASREAAVRVPDMAERALNYHRQIYAALAAHDPEEAAKSMKQHLDQVTEDIARARKVIKKSN